MHSGPQLAQLLPQPQPRMPCSASSALIADATYDREAHYYPRRGPITTHTHLSLVQVFLVPERRPPAEAGCRGGAVPAQGCGAASQGASSSSSEGGGQHGSSEDGRVASASLAFCGSRAGRGVASRSAGAPWVALARSPALHSAAGNANHEEATAAARELTWPPGPPQWAGSGARRRRRRWGGWAHSCSAWRRCPAGPQ